MKSLRDPASVSSLIKNPKLCSTSVFERTTVFFCIIACFYYRNSSRKCLLLINRIQREARLWRAATIRCVCELSNVFRSLPVFIVFNQNLLIKLIICRIKFNFYKIKLVIICSQICPLNEESDENATKKKHSMSIFFKC